MLRLRIIAVVALAISLLAAVACQSESEPPSALLETLSGSVEVFSGPESSLTVVSDEIELNAGDRIRVPDQSRAVVVFFEGSVMLLDGGTDVTLEEVAGTREVGSSSIAIYQSVGRTVHRVVKLVDAESSYGVRTSNSVGGVRGTGFVVEQDPVTGARWKSFEGTIGVAGASRVETLVETGKVTEVPPAADPSPPVDEPLTADEQALVDAIDEVIEARDLPAPPAKDPEQSTPIAAPTPTLVPVEQPAPQAALAELPPPVTPSPIRPRRRL